jgi:hypothetical protein
MWGYGRLALTVVGIVCVITACRTGTILRAGKHERTFREQYIGKPFYTAFVARPYKLEHDYVIDLTGRVAEMDYETVRANVRVPLGSPITITAVEPEYLRASIVGFQEDFRIVVATHMGTAEALQQELAALLAPAPPLPTVREAMRPFVARGELARGMSRREVQMTWGIPDKANAMPGATSVIEEWVYYDKGMHVFLKNGFVTNWQRM